MIAAHQKLNSLEEEIITLHKDAEITINLIKNKGIGLFVEIKPEKDIDLDGVGDLFKRVCHYVFNSGIVKLDFKGIDYLSQHDLPLGLTLCVLGRSIIGFIIGSIVQDLWNNYAKKLVHKFANADANYICHTNYN